MKTNPFSNPPVATLVVTCLLKSFYGSRTPKTNELPEKMPESLQDLSPRHEKPDFTALTLKHRPDAQNPKPQTPRPSNARTHKNLQPKLHEDEATRPSNHVRDVLEVLEDRKS